MEVSGSGAAMAVAWSICPGQAAAYLHARSPACLYSKLLFLFSHRTFYMEGLRWRREIQNKNGANSKTTEYAANIQKADLEEALQARYLMCSVQFPAVALQL